ncbi:MAG TPA: hypothetical protein VFV96_01800 [Verrucomicrobiae bacterium]|nr:hypothetical protein [Verrucomicrobiae bacterium]
MNEWNIQSRAHACTACAQPFADKQNYHTVLFEEHAEFRRHDLCEACWQRDFGTDVRERKGFISHWQGTYEAPPPPTEVVPKENAESLLRKLIAQNDPAHAPAAYILAVMLERKRLLKIKEQFKREGQRIFVYEHPKTGDVFTIADPDLQLNQLEQVQRDVAHLLEYGFTPPTDTGSQTVEPEPRTLPQVGPETVVAENSTPADESRTA